MRAVVLIGVAAMLAGAAGFEASAQQPVADPLRGPFISGSMVVQALDCPTVECNGPLNFSRMLLARAGQSQPRQHSSNPFNLSVAKKILTTIQDDLKEIRKDASATDGQLSPNFLTDEGIARRTGRHRQPNGLGAVFS